MAAKVFQIVGIIVLAVSIFLFIFLLPALARILKKTNSSLAGKARLVGDQMRSSINGMDAAQDQIKAASEITASVKAGMSASIRSADRALGFLNSRPFQAGVPILLWVLLFAIALPRGLRKLKKKKKIKPIPPPSWEKAEAALKTDG